MQLFSSFQSLCLFVFMRVFLFLRQSFCLFVCLSVCSSVFLFVRLSFCLFVCLSVCSSVFLFVRLSLCLSAFVSLCLSLSSVHCFLYIQQIGIGMSRCLYFVFLSFCLFFVSVFQKDRKTERQIVRKT